MISLDSFCERDHVYEISVAELKSAFASASASNIPTCTVVYFETDNGNKLGKLYLVKIVARPF